MEQSSIYQFRKVKNTECDKLQQFLDTFWKKGHSLAKSTALLDWQHLDYSKGEYNFFVAENKQSGEFDALIGFIPLSQFDNTLLEDGNYWGAIWKIREDINNTEINAAGFLLLKKLFKLPFFSSYAAIGISSIAKQIYEALHIPVGVLSHYYILNECVNDFKVAIIKNCFHQSNLQLTNWELIWSDIINWDDIVLEGTYSPRKTPMYMKNRYALHPIYNYNYIMSFNGSDLKNVMICRKIFVNGVNIIRIVDVLGELGGSLYSEFQKLLIEQQAEYIDCLNFGLDSKLFLDMGFIQLDYNGENIIPNYFEPFEQRNVQIEIAYKSYRTNYVAFKGDSDQDRPNIL